MLDERAVTPLEDVVLIVADDRAVVEADLAVGRLLCPVVVWACWAAGLARGCARFDRTQWFASDSTPRLLGLISPHLASGRRGADLCGGAVGMS